MYRHGFVEKDIDPSTVYSRIKDMLVEDKFNVTSDESNGNLREMHAKKSNRERIVLGKVRDVDAMVAGQKGKFEVQLHAGIWGRDLAVPAIEGIFTFGAATAAEVHSGHEYELNLWKKVVNLIDPSLKMCDLDGLLFNTQEDLDKHMKTHQQQAMGYGSGMGMMGMGMLGMGMMGMMGMGMMGGGFWI